MNTFQIFEPKFDNPELEQEFQDFFTRNGLDPLFTYEHKAGAISVTWTDARSVVNESGSYSYLLKNFADILLIANDNQNYKTVLLQILYHANTFQKMMRNIRKIVDEFSIMPEKYLYNMWNAVKYTNVVA